MAKMIQIPYDYSITVPVTTAQSVQENHENPVSLEALGLLVNLLSYPSTWELHKTELYKRFAKNKESSVRSAWKDLMAANYIIEFKYRVGRKWEYVYYFRKVPFTSEEKAEILANAESEYGEIRGLDFQDPKMRISKSRGNQKNLLNKNPISNIHTNNNNKEYMDDDKRTSPNGEDSAVHNDDMINILISNLREATREELTDRSFNTVVRKVVDKYGQGKIGKDKFRDYLIASLVNKIEELELRRLKDKGKQHIGQDKMQQVKAKIQNQKIKEVPFWNWLED